MSGAPDRVKFTDLAVVLRPSIKVQKSDYLSDGLLPVVDQGAGLIGGFANDMNARFPSPEPVIVFGDHTCRFKYVPFPFAAGADGTQVFRGRDGIDTRYLYFACLTLGLEHFGYQRHMKHLKVADVPVWPLPTQQRIAAILSAYDDLIETNTRRIAILEEMARRLYEEWFVHFRFPGHEAAEFDEDLPRGWSAVELGDLVDELREAIKPETIDPETPYVGLEHIPRRSITMREWSSASAVQSTKLRFIEDDILFGKIRPYFHKVALAPMDGVASSDAIILRAKSREYLSIATLCASSEPFVDHATQTSNGTKMPRANWKVLTKYPVVLPADAILARFNQFVLPLFDNLKLLNRQNTNLRAQRDLLLPKLVSGEIDVSGAEAALEAAE